MVANVIMGLRWPPVAEATAYIKMERRMAEYMPAYPAIWVIPRFIKVTPN